tara:strand:+ start:872 stop:1129 length:258 start_codon:yes stop_codon:yes gene_type:complete
LINKPTQLDCCFLVVLRYLFEISAGVIMNNESVHYIDLGILPQVPWRFRLALQPLRTLRQHRLNHLLPSPALDTHQGLPEVEAED